LFGAASCCLSNGFEPNFLDVDVAGIFSAGFSSVYPNGLIPTFFITGFLAGSSSTSSFFSNGFTVAFLTTTGFSATFSSYCY
jgi:hypothetical protein